jgi:hypothetical protein
VPRVIRAPDFESVPLFARDPWFESVPDVKSYPEVCQRAGKGERSAIQQRADSGRDPSQ